MKKSASFEVTLRRRDSDSYSVVLRCTLPGGEVDVTSTGVAQFDFERLRALSLQTLPYADLLTNSLFKDPAVATAFNEVRTAAQALKTNLQFRLVVDSNAPELHGLHWETLLDLRDRSYLFAGEHVLFSRYLSSLDWQPVNLSPRTQLTALVVVANPANLAEFQLPPIDVQGEVTRAQTSMRGVGVTTLASAGTATLNKLSDCLRDGGHDILYLVCHGSIVDGEPWLWMEDGTGNAARVSGSSLVARLKDLRQRPALIVLASCQSAGSGGGGNVGACSALVSLGPRLGAVGIPAVLAMQGSVSMETVSTFMPVFFRELLRDGQIDRATAVARGAVSDRPDFWMPVLFMRLKSGRIWKENPTKPSLPPPAPDSHHDRKRLITVIAGTLALLVVLAFVWRTISNRDKANGSVSADNLTSSQPTVLKDVPASKSSTGRTENPPVSNENPTGPQPVPKDVPAPTSDFPGGSQRVYAADFLQWPSNTTAYGSARPEYGEYVIQPTGNVVFGPGHLIDIQSIDGDFVLDVNFRIEERTSSASLQVDLLGSGQDADYVEIVLVVWDQNKVTYSIQKGWLKNNFYMTLDTVIVSRQALPINLAAHDWSKGSKITLKRQGGSAQFFVNDSYIRDFPVTLFPVARIGFSAGFPAKIGITSVEARKP